MGCKREGVFGVKKCSRTEEWQGRREEEQGSKEAQGKSQERREPGR